MLVGKCYEVGLILLYVAGFNLTNRKNLRVASKHGGSFK